MTKNFCDVCEKEILWEETITIHRWRKEGKTLCPLCFSNQEILLSMRHNFIDKDYKKQKAAYGVSNLS